MAEPRERRSERLEVRMPPSLYTRVSRAAAMRGQTLAAFVSAAVQEAAQRTFDEAEITRLNDAEFEQLVRALDAAPEPNAALLAAAERYRTHLTEAD